MCIRDRFNVDAIEQFNRTLALDRETECIIQQVKDDARCALVWCSTGKIVDLAKEKYTLAFNDAVVEAGFVDSRNEPDFTEDTVDVLFPETWGFGMALHCFLDRDDVAMWNRFTMLVLGPPVVECSVWTKVSTLFWRWCFSKSVRDVRTKND